MNGINIVYRVSRVSITFIYFKQHTHGMHGKYAWDSLDKSSPENIVAFLKRARRLWSRRDRNSRSWRRMIWTRPVWVVSLFQMDGYSSVQKIRSMPSARVRILSWIIVLPRPGSPLWHVPSIWSTQWCHSKIGFMLPRQLLRYNVHWIC